MLMIDKLNNILKKGYRIVEKIHYKIIQDRNDNDAIIKHKDKEIEYLKAKVEYLKKLSAVVEVKKH